MYVYDAQQGQRLNLRTLLSACAIGTHVYGCGPGRLIADLRAQAALLGWPDARVHVEACRARTGPAV